MTDPRQASRDAIASANSEEDLERRRLDPRFSEFLEAAPDAMIVAGESGEIVFANSRAERLFGYERGELTGSSVERWMRAEARSAYAERCRAFLTRPEAPSLRPLGELSARRKDGAELAVEVSLSAFETPRGPLLIHAIRDTTQRKLAEDALRASEARVRLVLEAADEAFIEMDAEGRITEWSPKAEAIFGWSRTEALGRSFADTVIPEAQRGAHGSGLERLQSAGTGSALGRRVEFNAVDRSGREFPAEITLSPIREGGMHHFAAFVQDITERKKDEQRFRDLLESAPDAMVIVNREGRIVLVNSQAEKLFDYARADLLGQPVELLVPARFDGHAQFRSRYFADPRPRAMGSGLELYGRRRDGSEFPVEISLSPLETSEGTLVSSAIRDVSDRRKADELKFRLAAIVDFSEDAIVGKTLDGVVVTWNRGAERLFGYTAEEMIGKSIALLFPPDIQDEEQAIVERLRQGERVQPFESIRRRKDGREIDVSVTISPIRDSRGVLVGASKVARDISDRKRAELALAHAKEAAETAGREFEAFSYSVAHDLRAPLRGIDGFSQALLEDYAEKLDDEGRRFLGRVRQSAQHMAQLIDSLLTLARVTQSELRRDAVDLSSIARGALGDLLVASPERQVEIAITDGLLARGDARLLRVALQNLIGNAWKFTAKCERARIEFGAQEQAGQLAFLVRDNGAGFDEKYASKLFGVFQRLHTTSEFEGIGIGLATVQRIVRRHGGRIWAEGKLGAGATFFFTLNERDAAS